MRLIDADLFKENILSGLYIFCQENKEDIARAIDSEPTVNKCDNCDLMLIAKMRDMSGELPYEQ